MSYDNANEVVNELFETLPLRYPISSETLIRDSDSVSIQFNFFVIHVTR